MTILGRLLNRNKSKPSHENIKGNPQVVHGTTCEVQLVTKSDGTAVAVKKFKAWDRHSHHKVICQKEYELLTRLHHVNIVAPLDYNSRKHSITFPCYRCTLQSLLNSASGPSFEEKASWFCQISQGIAYLHSQDVVHRDLKLDNVMLDSSLARVKLIDFGSAAVVDGQKDNCHGICGSEQLMAPEVFQRISYKGKPVDLWSLGIVMYEFFNAASTPAFPWKKAKHGDPAFDDYSKDPKSLLIEIPLCFGLLCIDFNERTTIQDVLNDSFYVENCKYIDQPEVSARTQRLLNRSKTT